MADALVELNRRRRRLDIQLGAQRLDTRLILAERQMILALAAITAHKPAVRVFTAVILRERKLAKCRAGCILALAEIELSEAIERVQVGHPQPLAGQYRPLLIGIICHEVAL